MFKCAMFTYIDWKFFFALGGLLAQEVELWAGLGESRKPVQNGTPDF